MGQTYWEYTLPKKEVTTRLLLWYKNSALKKFPVLESNVLHMVQTCETGMLKEQGYRL